MGSEEGSQYKVAEALTRMGLKKNSLQFEENETIYAQGDESNSVFYLEQGRVKVTIVSQSGKEAVLALLSPQCHPERLIGHWMTLLTPLTCTFCYNQCTSWRSPVCVGRYRGNPSG